jgi:hypothetical protein
VGQNKLQLNGPYDLFWKTTSGAGEDQELLKSSDQKYPLDWCCDGRFLLYATQGRIGGGAAAGAKADWDLWVWPMQGPQCEVRQAILVLTTPANETQARFSLDGRGLSTLPTNRVGVKFMSGHLCLRVP